jgi:hypothetical protein
LLVFGLLGFVWPFAPMHQRQVIAAGGGDFGDTLHRALGIVTVVLFVSTLGFGAGAFGKRFRLYSLATLAICLVTGALVGVNSSRLAANLPTPLVGLWERICITAYMIWSAALAAALLRKPMTATPRVTQGIGRLRHDDDFSTTADATHSH